MIKKNLALAVTLLALSISAQASILTSEAGDKKVESVTIAKTGTVSLDGQSTKLDILGAGLRQKKVILVNVSVYVAELFSSDAAKFVRTSDEALSSLDKGRTVALRLNFLRTVDADTVQVSFRDALTANSVDLSDTAVAAFLETVKSGGEATNGKSMVIVTQKNADGSESVTYEDTKGTVKTTKGTAGFSKKIMSIWLGTPSDAGVGRLKESLIKGL